MGGSGGGYFSGRSGDLAQKLRDAAVQARDHDYEARVNQQLKDFLKDFNKRDAAGTRKILDDVKKRLGDEIGGTVDLVFGGSVSRHTYLDGLSDTDALVILEPDDVGRRSPELLKERFAQKLREVFGKENVKVGDLAVTVTTMQGEIQLLPAMREGDRYQIASPDGRSWSRIDHRGFAEKLTQTNVVQGKMLVPAIKVVKAIVASLPMQQQLKGYHIESLAIEVFKKYEGPRTYKAMVTHFFERAAELVNTPVKDRTGQSLYVDEYLGPQNSSSRRIASQAIQRIHRKLMNADASKNSEAWTDLVCTG